MINPLVQLSDLVSVIPSEVVAVTRHPKVVDESAVYLRGSGGRAFLHVKRPMVDVVGVLEAARTGGCSPPTS